MAAIEKMYEKYGEVCHLAHMLEVEIGNISAMNSLVMNKDKYEKASASERLEILSKHSYGISLGRLLKDIGETIGNTKAIDTIFEPALTERNRLIHDFYYGYREEIKSAEGREIIIQDLARTRAIIANALSTANSFSGELMKLFPVNQS